MTDPNAHFAAVVKAKDAVLAHPMCGRLEDDGAAFLVIFPAGDFPVDGVRVNYSGGKARALETCLGKMEMYWVQSYPGWKP